MTLKECTAILTPLALQLRQQIDVPTFRAYHRVLEDVQPRLLQAAVDHVAKTPRQAYEPAFPTAPTLRTYAEQARLALLAAVPYTGCAECGGTGWRPTEARSVERCPCKQRHLEQLARLGLGPALVAPQLEAGEFESFDARMAQAGDS